MMMHDYETKLSFFSKRWPKYKSHHIIARPDVTNLGNDNMGSNGSPFYHLATTTGCLGNFRGTLKVV